MKKIVVLMSLVLVTSLAWADSGTRSTNVVDQGDGNWTVIDRGNNTTTQLIKHDVGLY